MWWWLDLSLAGWTCRCNGPCRRSKHDVTCFISCISFVHQYLLHRCTQAIRITPIIHSTAPCSFLSARLVLASEQDYKPGMCVSPLPRSLCWKNYHAVLQWDRALFCTSHGLLSWLQQCTRVQIATSSQKRGDFFFLNWFFTVGASVFKHLLTKGQWLLV